MDHEKVSRLFSNFKMREFAVGLFLNTTGGSLL
jgi:hypothetical protein